MKRLKARIALRGETIRVLTGTRLHGIVGGAAATDGATDCVSEHGSCVRVSCGVCTYTCDCPDSTKA